MVREIPHAPQLLRSPGRYVFSKWSRVRRHRNCEAVLKRSKFLTRRFRWVILAVAAFCTTLFCGTFGVRSLFREDIGLLSQGSSRVQQQKVSSFNTRQPAQSKAGYDVGDDTGLGAVLHAAFIFDDENAHKHSGSYSTIRSLAFYTRSRPLALHLIAPIAIHPQLLSLPAQLPGNVRVRLYDASACHTLVSRIWFIARTSSRSELCRLFLADIVETSVQKLLYFGNQVTVLHDVSGCWDKMIAVMSGNGSRKMQVTDTRPYIAMSVDMGDACQLYPNRCFPIGFQWEVPRGLECGTTPRRAKILRDSQYNGYACRKPLRSQDEHQKGVYRPDDDAAFDTFSDEDSNVDGRWVGADAKRLASPTEPYVYNTGVMVLNVAGMRQNGFATLLTQTALHTWRRLGMRSARWGAQDLLNNFVRLYPEALAHMPCQCNYQFSGPRRETKCAGQSITIAQAWTLSMSDARLSGDPYAAHFKFFEGLRVNLRGVISGESSSFTPPKVPVRSLLAPDWVPAPFENGTARDLANVLPAHDGGCWHQTLTCAHVEERRAAANLTLGIMQDTVHILTRVSGDAVKHFEDMASSVREQTHTSLEHIVGTSDGRFMRKHLQNSSAIAVLVPPSAHQSQHSQDPEYVCQQCGGRCNGHGHVESKTFMDCFCASTYPLGALTDALHRRVGSGWVMYVDGDEVLRDKFVVSELLATVESREALIAFRSQTVHGVAPSEINFSLRRLILGDFGHSNFAFFSTKSSGLHLADGVRRIRHINARDLHWGLRRCDDFYVSLHLANVLSAIQWIDRSYIQTNPARAALGYGLGHRPQFARPPLTVVITAFQVDGWRPAWVRRIVSAYLDNDMRRIVHRVILVWNNVGHPVPATVPTSSRRFVVLQPQRNSLNNRWIETLPHIETSAVLNLDDDVYVKKTGVLCMLNWLRAHPNRMIAPHVRFVDTTLTYSMNELHDGHTYNIVLPRVLLTPVSYLKAYAKDSNAEFHSYIDKQDAHCDDILLNLVALKESRSPPLRVLLPEESIVDFYGRCWQSSRNLTGGLGLQLERWQLRTECVHFLTRAWKMSTFNSTTDTVATCLPRGNAFKELRRVEPERFLDMVDQHVECTNGS